MKDIFVTNINMKNIFFSYRFVKFGITGCIGYIVNAGILSFLSQYIVIEFVLWSVSTLAALIVIFVLNQYWTFNTNNHFSLFQKWLIFLLTSSGAFLLQIILGTLLVLYFGVIYRQIILIAVIFGVIAPYNWYMYNHVVWKK